MNWPVYFKDSLIVGDVNMDTAVVTLWTPKEVVAKALNMSRISLVGQLYTKRGINFIIRNILANPRIKKLHIVGSDLSGSGQALLDSTFDLDRKIDPKAFESFKQNVRLIDNRIIPAKGKILGRKSSLWGEPQIFEEDKPVFPSTYPSEFSSMVIRASTIPAAWVQLLKILLRFGVESKPVMFYDSKGHSKIKELLNLVVVIKKEDSNKIEVPSFMGFSKRDVSSYVVNFFKKGKGAHDYTYGERLFDYGGFDQVGRMVEKLRGFPQDKGALCVLWKPKEDSYPHYKSQKPKRVPCLVLVQGQIYGGKLFITAFFRSNDMGSAWPLNAYALRALQGKVAKELGVGLGSLTTISNMAHLYERDYGLAEKVIKAGDDSGNCAFDPRGNLIIKTEGDVIKVSLIAPTGERVLGNWEEDGSKPNASQSLGDRLVKDLVISQVAHAMDIGRQLARAEEAIKRGLKFTQDRPLPL